MNENAIKAARKTNAYGGGGSFGWAPNLLANTHKEQDFKNSIGKKQNNMKGILKKKNN